MNVEQIFDGSFFAEGLDFPNCDKTHKINGFSPQFSSTSVLFQSDFMMVGLEHVITEEYKFEN